jgi:RHS repeat-associated protein
MKKRLRTAYAGALAVFLAVTGSAFAAEKITYYHFDALGSPVAATDDQGNIVWRKKYTPYGEETKTPSTPAESRSFTGHVRDAETGLIYAGARYIDPVIGRFMATDPVSFTETNPYSFNRYSYANNNPYKFWDPDGREVKLQWHGVAFGDYHTLVRITPDNQARYTNDPRFSNVDANGRRFATMGAGPVSGKLVSEFNRERDAAPHEGGSIVQPPKGLNEDKFIDRLIGLDAKYGDNLDYDLFPANPQDQKWWRADDGYNSNSYTSGLLGASGAKAPRPPVSTPGWDKPVPQEHFR